MTSRNSMVGRMTSRSIASYQISFVLCTTSCFFYLEAYQFWQHFFPTICHCCFGIIRCLHSCSRCLLEATLNPVFTGLLSQMCIIDDCQERCHCCLVRQQCFMLLLVSEIPTYSTMVIQSIEAIPATLSRNASLSFSSFSAILKASLKRFSKAIKSWSLVTVSTKRSIFFIRSGITSKRNHLPTSWTKFGAANGSLLFANPGTEHRCTEQVEMSFLDYKRS